ncbi:PhzF family phenazine biosynthesis protein [Pseudoxanthomonas winnipegensis]|uniref:PhzF family phenazine biosynthesis protein n=1 Tax=Pseudoxanthomonas winnipegensis TaxID=2480810 RepID=A0AAW8G819_9GAMM|nr:PhzF family phenazine biosynthesis protein [Pseudoxanthomonas winnipegensis]MDQ1118559.1 PhzF family phenazine biosynthesis protein [Pseudoxanthomonas winnipegensis]MDQ1131743.1 PhzF family phenazine biosynthesis protein [Pseudoxanthomonas winnipegensis]
MQSRRFLQVDVFSARAGNGNPLAVVLDAQGLDEAAMQAIARWTKLPETTFVFPAQDEGASYRLRMFAPQKEVPFAGHPSVGTAHAVLAAGLAVPRDGVLIQDGIAGRLPLRVETIDGRQRIAIRVPRASLAEVVDPADGRLAPAIAGWPLGALPPALMDGGRKWWVVELADEAALRGLTPDWDAIAALAEGSGAMGVFAYARATGQPDYQLAVRAFVGNGRRFEDAASGAANAVLAAWLDQRGALPGSGGRYVASQGREVGFDALLELSIDAAGEVWSGGQVQTVVRGTLDW